MSRLLVAIDQGTTGSTAVVVTDDGRLVGKATVEFPQHFPQPGWVEHDLDEIWESVVRALDEALRMAGVRPESVAAVGITNQRETTVLWERETGRPVARAIVWQDRRTADRCRALRAAGHEPEVRRRTGLVLDPYFSATKIAWLLDAIPGLRERARRGAIAFGTIDSWLVWKLSGGAVHVTDASNASRTSLFDLREMRWSDRLLELFDVPRALLPEVRGNAERYAAVRGVPGLPDGVPIAGMAGDQQAALFGQACFEPGEAKVTYGTGAFLLVNTGDQPVESRHGLLTTVAWRLGDRTTYALEGATFIAGAAVQWLRDGLGIITSAAEVESLARSVDSSDGVVFVPALTGLGAPHWDPDARGLILGITRGTTRAHLARATLEGIASQVADVTEAMASDMGRPIGRLRVDGGAAANDLLMQMQADLSAATVERPVSVETTALGAAYLAGLGAGLLPDLRAVGALHRTERAFRPSMAEPDRAAWRARWEEAVRRARSESSR
ncbi:MAG: glycerol kinase GlpK [Myxococcota bacterium]|nr:glycerol kinase GlpK [Myxococcota bacterium]